MARRQWVGVKAVRGYVRISYYWRGDRIRRNVGPDSEETWNRIATWPDAIRMEVAEGRHDPPKFFAERGLRPAQRDRKRADLTGDVTVAAFAEAFRTDYAASEHKDGGRRARQALAHFVDMFGPRLLSSIQKRDVLRFKRKRLKDVSAATVNRELAYAKSMYNVGIDWEVIEANPFRIRKIMSKETPRVRYLVEDEWPRLLAACPSRLDPIVRVARETGMRRGELVTLRWRCVNLQTCFAHLPETKAGDGRDVPLNETAIVVLRSLPRRLRDATDGPGDLVFTAAGGGRIDPDWLSKRFRATTKKAGIDDLHLHDLRHDFASRLVMKGRSLEEVRRVLGHKTLAMTARYAHLSPAHTLDVVRSLDGLEETSDATPQTKESS